MRPRHRHIARYNMSVVRAMARPWYQKWTWKILTFNYACVYYYTLFWINLSTFPYEKLLCHSTSWHKDCYRWYNAHNGFYFCSIQWMFWYLTSRIFTSSFCYHLLFVLAPNGFRGFNPANATPAELYVHVGHFGPLMMNEYFCMTWN